MAAPRRPRISNRQPGKEERSDRKLRSDAQRNRDRIIEAARQVFEEQGLDVGVDEIADRAGVGVGTVYRRFPNKQALVEAIIGDLMTRFERLVQQALERPDPGEAFRWFLYESAALQAENHGLRDHMTGYATGVTYLARFEKNARAPLQQLVVGAQEAGAIRGDVRLEDIHLIINATAGAIRFAEHGAPDVWRRLLDLLMDGLRPEGATPLSAPALTPAQHRAVHGAEWPPGGEGGPQTKRTRLPGSHG